MTASPAVVVMPKAPRAGAVKTRLVPQLGPTGCAELQMVLLHQAVVTALAGSPGSVVVAVDPPAAVPEVAAGLPAGLEGIAQEGADLGERMAAAAGHAFAAGRRPVVVIGTDVPLLRPGHLLGALDLLGSGDDVVFGPALDGGYYLVALSLPSRAVFALDPAWWGGPSVLEASRAAALAAGLTTGFRSRCATWTLPRTWPPTSPHLTSPKRSAGRSVAAHAPDDGACRARVHRRASWARVGGDDPSVSAVGGHRRPSPQ